MKKAVMYVITAASLSAASSAFAVDNIQGLAMTCNNCHGTGGVSVGLSMPSIAGLSETYLKNILMEWKSGARSSANMTRLISGYTDEEIAGLAAYYSKLPWKPQVQTASADVLKKGKEATERCETCHGDTGGKPDGAEVPMLAGQWSKYLELELMKYRDEGFLMSHKKMTRNARKLEEADVGNVTKFFGAQSK